MRYWGQFLGLKGACAPTDFLGLRGPWVLVLVKSYLFGLLRFFRLKYFFGRPCTPFFENFDEKIGENSLSVPLKEAREKFEKEYLTIQLKKFNGNISKTANFVGMERSALHRKLKVLGIKEFN